MCETDEPSAEAFVDRGQEQRHRRVAASTFQNFTGQLSAASMLKAIYELLHHRQDFERVEESRSLLHMVPHRGGPIADPSGRLSLPHLLEVCLES